jgi:hypothetical protein
VSSEDQNDRSKGESGTRYRSNQGRVHGGRDEQIRLSRRGLGWRHDHGARLRSGAIWPGGHGPKVRR